MADAFRRFLSCIQPLNHEQASWAVYGTGILLVLAALIYLAYPAWFIHKRRLTPLDGADCPELLDCLAELTRQAGLDRAPMFLLAPYASTSGGLAFGHFRSHYVQLDAGLVTAFATDRPKFRAVVLHELAHLKNHDVNITYLTMSIWWSFVVVALIPMIALTLRHPHKTYQNGLALLLTTGVVYLTRNTILRVRELHADARASESDGPNGALRTLVGTLTLPTWWRALIGTHPHPRWRMRAIDNPAAVLSPKLWELFATGMVTAMIAVQLNPLFQLFANQLLVNQQMIAALPGVESAFTGMLCFPGLAGPLVVAVWRATARVPSHRLPLRQVLPMPVALVAGFLIGQQLSWASVTTEQWRLLFIGEVWDPLIGGVPLLVGAVVLAVWTASVAYTVLNSAGHGHRWALPIVVTTGIAAFAPWFGEWITRYRIPLNRMMWSPFDGIAGAPGWFAAIVRWGGDYVPVYFMTHNSLTLPSLALLWLVPILVMAYGRKARPEIEGRPYHIGVALLSGLTGAAVFALAGVIVAYALKAALPALLRRNDGFPEAVARIYVALAVLAQAGVAATVAAFARRHRPVLVPLAVLVTGLLAFGVVEFLSPIGHCVDLGTRGPMGIDLYAYGLVACFQPFEAVHDDLPAVASALHRTLVQGAIAAVPATLIGAAIQALLRRLRGAATSDSPKRHCINRGWTSRTLSAVSLSILLAAVIAGALAEAPNAYQVWFVDPTIK